MTGVIDPQEQLIIATDVRGDVAMVTVTGEIDLESVDAFIEPLLRLASYGIDQFVLDVSGITFIDSTGLTALVRLTRAGNRTSVRLTGTTEQLLTLLQITGLDEVIVAE